MPRDAQSMQKTQDKVGYVGELLKADAAQSMFAVGKKVKEKFGTMLAFDKLRAAFTTAGGKVLPRGRGVNAEGAEAKPRKQGRRKADRAAAVVSKKLTQLPQHIVVVRGGDVPELHEFDSPQSAAAFAKTKVQAGTPTTALAYYKREAVEIQIGL